MQEISVPRQRALHASLMSEGQVRSYLTEYAARGAAAAAGEAPRPVELMRKMMQLSMAVKPHLSCRPHHEELHGWANQLLLSKSVLLEALQQQVEKQAAMTELIRKIREPEAGPASMPAAPRMHQPPMLEPPSPSASLSIDRDFAHAKVGH